MPTSIASSRVAPRPAPSGCSRWLDSPRPARSRSPPDPEGGAQAVATTRPALDAERAEDANVLAHRAVAHSERPRGLATPQAVARVGSFEPRALVDALERLARPK